MNAPALQIEDLTKIYEPKVGLDHLNLTVNRGEVFWFTWSYDFSGIIRVKFGSKISFHVFFLWLPVILLLVTLGGVGISSIMVMGVVLIVSPRRAVEVLGFASFPVLIYQILSLSMVVAGQASLMLSFGIWNAKFDWENPGELTGGVSGCIASVCRLVFTGVESAVAIGLLALTDQFRVSWWIGYTLMLGILICLSVAGGMVPLMFTMRRIPGLENEKYNLFVGDGWSFE